MLSTSRTEAPVVRETDGNPVREAVERFAARQLAVWRDQPARVPQDDEVAAVVAAAGEAGLLARDGVAGHWWRAGDGIDARDACAMLDILGGHHAGLAFHLHRLALGEWLQARLGLEVGGRDVRVLPWLPDGHVLSSTAFVRFLARGVPLPVDAALLPVPGAALRWQAAPVWDALLVPVQTETAVSWHRLPRNAWAVDAGHGHGLDGTLAHRALAPEVLAAAEASLSGEEAARVFIELLGRDAMGLMAIALGVVRRAGVLARNQADIRVQGGKHIREHAAVQLLLADAQAAVECSETLLSSFAAPPDALAGLRRLCAQRLVAHDLLCRGANAAMQVFGGMGYMRDVGLERAVRDNNQLRVTSGAPGDLKLFITRAEQQS